MFDDIKPINPKAERLKKRLIFGVPMVLMLGGYLFYEFKNYPEERAVSRFLMALEQKDYQGAYKIWQPSKYYNFGSFNQDWGPQGMAGTIQNFKITNSHALGTGVVVDVRL